MKQALPVRVDQCLAPGLTGEAPAYWHYHHIIDARTPAEFALDHLPGAQNWPVLDNDQREIIGTMYQREGSFKAKREGAILVARNIASLLEQHAGAIDPNAKLLVYCWRGGNRSGALSTVLARIGFRTDVLEGGYKAFRRWVIEDTAHRVKQFRFFVIAGRTGSGKTDLLQHLSAAGEQIVDLEALAKHRGSLLGAEVNEAQPSQRAFETVLWLKLSQFDANRPVWLESESRKIGQIQIPEALIEAMRASTHYQLEAPICLRSEYLLKHYHHWIDEPSRLEARLQKLKPLMPLEVFTKLSNSLSEHRMADFVSQLLSDHYDPLYDRSIARNYRQAKHLIQLHALDTLSLQTAARALIEHRQSQDAEAVVGLTQPQDFAGD